MKYRSYRDFLIFATVFCKCPLCHFERSELQIAKAKAKQNLLKTKSLRSSG
jgi:hypothetical protein